MSLQALIEKVDQSSRKPKAATVSVGETVRVHSRVREGSKERIQVFEGLIIDLKKPKSLQGAFMVRKVIAGIGVERTFPLHSPHLVKVERLKTAKVRRAKLGFVRAHALSRRFRLKDKGVEGGIWEEVKQEQEAIASEATPEQSGRDSAEAQSQPEEVAKSAQSTDNAGVDDQADQDSGGASGEPGRDTAPKPLSQDPQAQSGNEAR